jgi:hypothetical protein
MKRLIAFGCSLTYGHGLPDCHVEPMYPGLTPSKLGWPEIVARNLNRKCVNMSTPGASNKKIWNSIVNFKFKKDDLVIILWSFEDRFCVLKEDKSIEDIGTWVESETAQAYYQHIHNEYDSLIQTKLFVSHANFFLNDKKIQTYNLTIEKETAEIFKLSGKRILHIPLYLCDNYQKKYPRALDGKHPGVECNSAFAHDILKYILPRENNTTISFIEKIKCILT